MISIQFVSSDLLLYAGMSSGRLLNNIFFSNYTRAGDVVIRFFSKTLYPE